MAYQRGDLLGALILFEESFRLDPDFEVALLNYARTSRALGLGDGASERVIRLVREAEALGGIEDRNAAANGTARG